MKTKENLLNYLSAMFLAVIATCLSLSSCQQEESEDLGDTPLFQRYMLTINPSGEKVAYAGFSKERNRIRKQVKLNGEQKITVNGKPMNYNRLDKNHSVEYSYSLELDKNTQEAEFSFIRFKGKNIKNIICPNNSLFISLPSGLKTIEAGKAVYWNGAAKTGDEVIEVKLESVNDKDYSQYYGTVTSDGKGFVFDDFNAKGKFILTLKRIITSPTTQNDRNADGEITLCYYDSCDIEI